MGIELLFLYLALMFVLGPGIVLYGVLIIARQRVRLYRSKILNGDVAVLAGVLTVIAGLAFTCFLWRMGQFLPH